jgi:2-polyprenyl-3-methyl-5-hydroxy-6-metoxy-1,4-benzoquinol methylase
MWPEDGLEKVPSCPLCGTADRELLHAELTDEVYRTAPGTWTLYRCAGCRSAYLDPRPTAETIGLAYATYYGHEVRRKTAVEELGLVGRLRRGVANGYRNARYGTADRPANPLGVALALAPGARRGIDTESRHLPRPVPGARLLDLGCGEGQFLEFARRAGWTVTGVDFDRKAVESARSRGLDIRLGGVDALGADERFDGITMSHVIEHVHDPLATLAACRKLLEPGGWIWVQTPNIDALGHTAYRQNWRGLEPPRHLVLFTPVSLGKALQDNGFTDVTTLDAALGCDFTFRASAKMAGHDTDETVLRGRIRAAEKRAANDPGVREFITVKAWARGADR